MANPNHEAPRGSSDAHSDADAVLVAKEKARLSIGSEAVELDLRLPDGRSWSLTFSPGIELFIGSYPRLPGLSPAGRCLTFRDA